MPVVPRRVLVTGSARGIGAAVAQAFAALGDAVAVHYRCGRADALAVLEALPGTGHTVVEGDVADPGAARNLVDSAVERLGGLDVCVNNAAVFDAHPPMDVSYEQWCAVFARTVGVNLLGAAYVSWCAAQVMAASGGGHIVNVGSRGAYRGEPDMPAYGASKAGLHALGQSLAVALAPHGIAVASVAPGFVTTERLREQLSEERWAQVRAQSPYGRAAAPEEVAAAVVWLASAEARWTSGAVLDVNGASYLR